MTNRILIAPLDWGLGHAARCIPLVRYFLSQGLEVYLASAGDAGILLQKEFPGLPFFSLPSYQVSYRHRLVYGLIRQLPHFREVMQREHIMLNELNRRYEFDIVLSDNRYGMWNPNIYSIFLTHQLNIQSPILPSLAGPFLREIHYRRIKPFDSCWVPDFEGDTNLSGILSHGIPLPRNTIYIGPLSRFNGRFQRENTDENAERVLMLFSGPEPHRSLLEEVLLSQARNSNLAITVVRGIVREEARWHEEKNIRHISYLTTDQLFTEISNASVVICRSGYSSLMDMAVCGKRAIFIPTPGQTEQQYLSRFHKRAGNYFSVSQAKFNLEEAIAISLSYKYLTLNSANNLIDAAYKNIIGEL